MKTLIAPAACLLVLAFAGEASAQWGTGNSSSWSNSSSSQWSASEGFGPNGYFNNRQSSQSNQSSFTQNRQVRTRFGVRNVGRTQTQGSRSNFFSNQGFGPGGFHHSAGGGRQNFNNGSSWNNFRSPW